MTSPLENTIREAVARGAYAEANTLLSEFCGQLQATDDGVRVKELLEWMLRRTRAARAHDAARLKELSAAMEYRRLPPGRLHTWQIDG